MKKLKILLMASTLALSGCFTTKTQVGAYKQTQGIPYTFAKGKQIWILGGLIPIGRTSVATPPDGNCEIVTKFTFGDVLIAGLTFGVVNTYTIKVKSKQRNVNTGYNTPSNPPAPAPAPPPSEPAPTTTPAEPSDNGTGTSSEFQVGEFVYMKNSLGNSFQVKIEYIEAGEAYVVYDNAMGVEKRKKVALRELSKRP